MEEVALVITKTAIKEAAPTGLGLVAGFFQAASGKEILPEEAEEQIRSEFRKQSKIKIDYESGRPIKLYLSVVDQKTLHISINSWIDRLPDGYIIVPPQAIDDLKNVLEIASGKKISNSNPQSQFMKALSQDPFADVFIKALRKEGREQQRKRKKQHSKSMSAVLMLRRFELFLKELLQSFEMKFKKITCSG